MKFIAKNIGVFFLVLLITVFIGIPTREIYKIYKDDKMTEEASERACHDDGAVVVYRMTTVPRACYEVVCFQTRENRAYERFVGCGR